MRAMPNIAKYMLTTDIVYTYYVQVTMAHLLEKEISQTKPLSLVDQAAANLHRSSAVLLQEVASYLAENDISPRQYNILRILRGAGDTGLCCGDIAARMVTPDPDTTRLLDRLVKRKWIRRRHSDHDRRVVRVGITVSGLKLLATLETKVQVIQHRQFQHLKKSELETLVALLESLRKEKATHEP
jgi:DNA-binding MarR family transcriptional regulator